MFKFFKKDKINIDSISIPNMNWNIDKNTSDIKQWINPAQTIALSVNFFDLKPDLPTIKDIGQLRDFYRNQISNYNGGLVEVEMIDIKGFNVIRTIFKIQQQPTGMTYLASLTIPFENHSYVIKIQAPEIGTTGIRDSMIASKLLNENKITIGDNGYEGWFSDPYNSAISEGLLMNKSEERKYDLDFPEHPLSNARKLLDKIEVEIEFDTTLQKAKKFRR
ncbi:hypothetical protein [Tenacibaculum sp. M341]|uniref:hypothetical protein n=1 Tax=Tenacibaculum sp. M341 TaxID=2530339 RepID=UPI0010517CF1|nr:hypothetical protein [Tenacibaculum sp. M341]TCI90575.1 hypothetical protein EYW44_12670 [Tenacibaculum sp. M341]